MTVSYSRSSAGVANRRGTVWDLVWTDGCIDPNVIFTITDLEETPMGQHLTLSNLRVLRLAKGHPRFAPGQSFSRLELSDLPADLLGYGSLWRIRTLGDERNRWRITPLFLLDDGRCLTQTVRHDWARLLTVYAEIRAEATENAFSNSRKAAETQFRPIHHELVRAHHDRLSWERDTGEHASGARRNVVEGMSLSALRALQTAQIEEGGRHWRYRLQRQARLTSEMSLLIIVHLEGGKPGA